jgi:5-methylcytosine-specific restriction endonuclease McrA
MTYSEILQSPHWLKKRTQIVNRDKLTCMACSNRKNIENKSISFIEHYIIDAGLPTQKIFTFKLLPELSPIQVYLSEDEQNILRRNDSIIYLKYDEEHRMAFVHSIRKMLVIESAEYIKKHKDLMTNYFISKNQRFKWSLAILNEPNQFEEFDTINDIQQLLDKYPIKYIDTLDNLKNYVWLYSKGLNVHHTYYKKGLLPWEYPDNSLETYCEPCHKNLHANKTIPIIDDNNEEVGWLTPCPKCGGAGEFPKYSHVEYGICFDCRGAKYLEFIDK